MSSIEKRKKSRVKRPPQEVVERLEEQTGFLVSSCRTFDEGNYAEAKRLSVHLRILLHTGRASVVSLLSQLGAAFKWNRFWSAMIPHNPHGLLSYHGLIVTKMGGSDIKYLPSLDGLADQFLQQHHFVKWWQRTIVFKDRLGQTFSRKDLVLALANTDGGAHVDSAGTARSSGVSVHAGRGWRRCGVRIRRRSSGTGSAAGDEPTARVWAIPQLHGAAAGPSKRRSSRPLRVPTAHGSKQRRPGL